MVLRLKRPIIIRNASDTYDFMYAVIHGKDILEENIHFDMAKEHFWVIALDRVDKTVNFELIAMGSNCKVTVDPVEVYSLPIYKRAAGIILVHNHPSGTLCPSEPDKDITDLLIQVGRMLKRPVIDHVIITDHSFYSFKNDGLFNILLKSIKHLPYYEREKQIEKEINKEVMKIKEEEKEKIKASKEESKIKGIEIGRREVAKDLREMDREIRKIKKEEQKKIKNSRQDGLREGKKEGKRVGGHEKAIEVAQRMLSKNYPIEEITGLTKLSKEEIKLLGK